MSALLFGIAQKRSEETRVHMVGNKDEEIFGIFEGTRELVHDLVHAVEEL